jgi:hypothetical protein
LLSKNKSKDFSSIIAFKKQKQRLFKHYCFQKTKAKIIQAFLLSKNKSKDYSSIFAFEN